MADLDGLRKRVEQIDLRLKTAHRAREKESAALMDMWEQIRERFADQNMEITQLRDRVADLEDTRDELLRMVHGLLSAVEGGLERMSDETVPRIKDLARGLLEESSGGTALVSVAAEPAESIEVHPHSDERENETSEGPNFHDDLLSAIEKSIDSVRYSNMPPRAATAEAIENKTVGKAIRRPADAPASPGIRDLVARIENSVGSEFLDTLSDERDDAPAEDDDELSRDLREIEALRGELNGLRERISSGR